MAAKSDQEQVINRGLNEVVLDYEDCLVVSQILLGLERTLFSGITEDAPSIVALMQYIEIVIHPKKKVVFRLSKQTPSELTEYLTSLLKAVKSDTVKCAW